MFDYAIDTSKWEKWQQDYRYGVLLIFPPDGVADEINTLRAKYDPRSFEICPAHISVSDPLRCVMTDSLWTEIQLALYEVGPFTLHFDKPESSFEYPGVYCPVSPTEPIERLKRLLHSTSAFSQTEFERRNVPPHMTIAEFLTIGESRVLASRLSGPGLSGSFRCTQLSLAIPNQDFHFTSVRSFPIGRG